MPPLREGETRAGSNGRAAEHPAARVPDTEPEVARKALGYYLPFRFGLGNPFHAGTPWKGMETALEAMSRVLAK